MDKEDKEILRHVLEKEIEYVKDLENEIIFPPLAFLKSRELYEEKLKELVKKLK